MRKHAPSGILPSPPNDRYARPRHRCLCGKTSHLPFSDEASRKKDTKKLNCRGTKERRGEFFSASPRVSAVNFHVLPRPRCGKTYYGKRNARHDQLAKC